MAEPVWLGLSESERSERPTSGEVMRTRRCSPFHLATTQHASMSTTRAALVARTLFASATTRSQPAPACRAARAFSSTSPSPFTWTRAPRSDVPLPWFVDPETAPTASPQPASPQLATAPVPSPPPPHLPQALHSLHNYLSTSPFLDRDELAYIHAREADPEGSWCDWVVVATLKEGRERGIRGAVEGVRRHVRPHFPLSSGLAQSSR